MKKFKIDNLNLTSKEKQKKFVSLDLFNLVDGSNISLPVALVGKGNDSLVTIIAAQHGNEWNGTFASHLLFKRLDPQIMEGKVAIIPIANPPAFTQRGRVSNLDYIDMNRTYGFVKKRKPTEHLAKIIFENFCSNADYVLDLHSGGPGEYLPLVETIDHDHIELAKSLNIGSILVRPKDTNSLVPNCEKLGIKSFSIEAGRALKLNYMYSEKIAQGIINFLKQIGVVKGQSNVDEKQKVYTGKIIIPAERSGFFSPSLKLGDTVKGGQEICTIWPFFQETPIKIKSVVTGTIVYLRSDEVINQGESIAHIADG